MKKNIKKPNFFIIGAPKCGTTSLSEYLGEHPDIFFSYPKEPFYFCTDFFNKFNRHFLTEKEYLEKYFKGAIGYKRVGEGSAIYLYSKNAVKNILEFDPKVKFIVMLRNPVEMFHSFYYQTSRAGSAENAKNPKEAWNLQKKRIEGEAIPPVCTEPKLLQYGEVCKLGKQIQRLFKIVPNKENIKIIRFERFKNNTKEVYEETLKFLDLTTDHRKEFPIYNRNHKIRSITLYNIFKILTKSSLCEYSRVLKNKIKIKHWPWFVYLNKINNKVVERKALDKEFRKELEEYFEEDQKLLREVLKENNYEEK